MVQIARGDLEAAAATTHRRTELLGDLGRAPDAVMELVDAYHMATEAHLGKGDIPAAQRFAAALLQLPSYREGQLAAIRAFVVDALVGDLDRVLAGAEMFRTEWARLGRPIVAYPGLGTGAVALVHGLRGDWPARAEWLAITTSLQELVDCYHEGRSAWRPMFDAIVALHHGRADEAVDHLAPHPDEMNQWYNGMWRQWYAAVWAEAAVLTEHPDTAERLDRADVVVAGNPVASAILARARALPGGDTDALIASATALDAAGCRYQAARSLVLAGGPHRRRGQERLEVLGAVPMASPGA